MIAIFEKDMLQTSFWKHVKRSGKSGYSIQNVVIRKNAYSI